MLNNTRIKKDVEPRKRYHDHKPWYTNECEVKRKEYFKFKNRYRNLRTHENEVKMVTACKQYKIQIKKAFREHQNSIIKKIRCLKSSDPKQYWKLLFEKEDKTRQNNVALNDFKEHFSNLNTDETSEEVTFNLTSHDNDDTILNSPFSVDEVKKCIHKLKSNKCPGPDNIINEFLKYSPQNILELYTDIFNVILKCGVVPHQWCIGYIRPLYKNKGDPNDPNYYRGITITSCLGELFTTLINSRLGKFVEDMELIGPEQAGSRSGYSTVDHIFVLNSLIDFYLFCKKRLYACFIDYRKAFDSIQGQQLWMKLCNLEIQGQLFDVIYDMYKKVKSCVSYGGQCSVFFPCEREDNLSPLLFNIFLSDPKLYLVNKYNGLSNIHDIATDIMDDNLVSYLKIYVFLYADDTILLAESPEELQTALNSMNLYCNDWNLKINVSKTKVIIFCRGKIRKHHHFYLGDKLLKICSDYLYLGVKFNNKGKFSKAQQEVFDKGNRAMFSILKRSRQLNLPIDLQFHLSNAIVLQRCYMVVKYGHLKIV